MTSPFTDERDRIEQALTFHTGCEPSAQEIIDALNRAGYQITPGPGYDHSGNDNHLVTGDHGPVITPQAGEWQQECGSIGLQHQCGRCGCEYSSPPPQAGEAEPVAWRSVDNTGDYIYSASDTIGGEPLYTAPPPPVCDGNHAAPACADPECWQRPSPVGLTETIAERNERLQEGLPPRPGAPVWQPPAALLMRIQSWRSGRQGALEEHEIYSLAVDMAEAILSALPPDSPGAGDL